ncbi:hypothetical protein [Oceanobacillus sojae]|uniref:Uncharacterized protein n=1 Tax=Oceanobacillus sojae TaxID=582851 RepID=A0A511ZIF5_9BACI|nr:hypothetical protein [Oceanobacillus sojae]GEN87210.1 hypothetical protein OSO01_19490 [Oceanobacillus sojae]
MDHPAIERTLRTGYPIPEKQLKDKPGEYWDPIKWMKEIEERYKNAK